MAPSFVTTRWSLVIAAGGQSADAREALQRLCTIYWSPLYLFVRHDARGRDAADLTQEFFAQLLARHDFAKANASRGRFRTWLLQSMRHFLANQYDRRTAQKRGGGDQPLSRLAPVVRSARGRRIPSLLVPGGGQRPLGHPVRGGRPGLARAPLLHPLLLGPSVPRRPPLPPAPRSHARWSRRGRALRRPVSRHACELPARLRRDTTRRDLAAATRRFGRDLRWRRVWTADAWVLPKRPLLVLLAIGVALGLIGVLAR